MRVARTLLTLAFALTLETTATADSITFRTGIDNTIYDTFPATRVLSNGLSARFFAGLRGRGGTLRGLLDFDLGARIAPGSMINAVTLTLRVNTPRPHAGTVNLHRVTTEWGEGTSNSDGPPFVGGADGARATPNDATWMHAMFEEVLWESPGGDFEAGVSASEEIVGSVFDVMFTGPGLVADVQAWIDGTAPNYGWLLKLDSETDLAIRFASFQEPSMNFRPTLEVDVTPIPEPTSAALVMLGLAGLAALRDRRR